MKINTAKIVDGALSKIKSDTITKSDLAVVLSDVLSNYNEQAEKMFSGREALRDIAKTVKRI